VIRSHFLNLVVFSVLVAVFFAFLTQERTRDRVRVVLILGGAMIVLSLIVAYVMYPFPMPR
jgi:lipoprotein signal peptidase